MALPMCIVLTFFSLISDGLGGLPDLFSIQIERATKKLGSHLVFSIWFLVNERFIEKNIYLKKEVLRHSTNKKDDLFSFI